MKLFLVLTLILVLDEIDCRRKWKGRGRKRNRSGLASKKSWKIWAWGGKTYGGSGYEEEGGDDGDRKQGNVDTGKDCSIEGPVTQRDELEGVSMELICEKGCIEIVNVLFGCYMSEGFSQSQKDLLQGKCENEIGIGVSKCLVSATNDFFGTNVQCQDKPAKLWLKFR